MTIKLIIRCMTCTDKADYSWEAKDFKTLTEAFQHLLDSGMSHNIELIIPEVEIRL